MGRKEGDVVLKIAICDDEKKYLDTSAAFLLEYAALRNVRFSAEQFDTPSDFLDTLDKGEHYDIYLLDVYMPGVTGVSVATELRQRNDESPIIFLTSSRDHAVEAFGVGATHYLLKPYTKDDFFAAMDKAMRSIGQDKPKTVLMKTANGYHNIPVGNIIYCESANHKQSVLQRESLQRCVSPRQSFGRSFLLSGSSSFAERLILSIWNRLKKYFPTRLK